MFSRCLFCHRDLPANESLEHFPVGRRVAYDPVRGRLWAVCPACRRWNLAPIEERWEALEELEKTVKDRARLLSQTDNIALLRSGDLDIVRVGRANMREEAWWRYGMELVQRRRSYQLLTALGVGGVLALMAGGAAAGVGVFGGWFMLGRLGRQAPKLGRALKFGSAAWRGRAVCPRCGGEITRIPFRNRGALVAGFGDDGALALGLHCLNCEYGRSTPTEAALLKAWGTGHRIIEAAVVNERGWRFDGRRRRSRPAATPLHDAADLLRAREGTGYLITGLEAEHLLRRVLAFQNFAGAGQEQVRRASSLIESAGSASSLTQQLTGGAQRLATLDPVASIALEIAVNEDRERRLLELELAALEQRWKEEEEIAAIVDGELTWVGSGTAVGGAGGSLRLPDAPASGGPPGPITDAT